MSYTTFDKLAARRWGVIGLKYRPVACPASYLENRHHLGRRLQEDKDKKPEMVIVDERFERPDGFQGPLPLMRENGRDRFSVVPKEDQITKKDMDLKAFIKEFAATANPETKEKLKSLKDVDLKAILKKYATNGLPGKKEGTKAADIDLKALLQIPSTTAQSTKAVPFLLSRQYIHI